MTNEFETTPEERARKRAKELVGLLWHLAAFLTINPFLWGIDIVTGAGVNWAYWVTLTWGVGLVFHVAAYMLDDNGLEERFYRKFLAEEQDRKMSQ